MADRVLRDDVLDSERYLGLSSDTARMLFIHFILVADDLGNTEASDLFIRRRLLPPTTSNAAIATLLTELSDADLIRVYETNAKRYVHIPRFRQRLRYTKSAHPRPPGNIECPEIKELLLKKPDLSPTKVSPETGSSRQKRREVKRSEEKLNPSASNAKIAFSAEGEWENISPRQRDVWERAYPALSLDAQLAAAAAWLIANPNNRKSNYARFLNGWFQRAQDRAPRQPTNAKVETDL